MAETEGFKNVVDVKWVLKESTGRLDWDEFRMVSRNPRQQLLVEPASESPGPELAARYGRILADQKARGIR